MLKSSGKTDGQGKESAGSLRGMGNSSGKSLKETSPLQDSEDLEDRALNAEKSFTFDDDSLHDHSYHQLFENILPKQTDLSPESNGNNTSDNNAGSNNVPITKPQRPNSIYNQETGSYKSNQSNLSADSFPSRSVSLAAACPHLCTIPHGGVPSELASHKTQYSFLQKFPFRGVFKQCVLLLSHFSRSAVACEVLALSCTAELGPIFSVVANPVPYFTLFYTQ